MPTRKLTEKSWQNNPGPGSAIAKSADKRDTHRGEKDQATFAAENHPKNARGVNICGAKKSNGKPCQSVAGKGTDHIGYGICGLHGGNTSTLRANAAKWMGGGITHEMTVAYGYGAPIDLDPHEALLQEVRRTGGHVAFLAERISLWELDDKKNLTPAQVEWREIYKEERAILVKVAKAAIDAGIAERRVRIAEDQGRDLIHALNLIFDALGLTMDQRRLIPSVVPPILRQLTEGAPRVINQPLT